MIDSDKTDLTPAVVGKLSELLGLLLVEFAAWGLPAKHGRIPVAQTLLRRVADADAFPTDPISLRRVAYAVRDADEFTRIGDAIRQRPEGEVRNDLIRSLRGELGGLSRATRAALQYQSQFYIGSMFVHGEWPLKVPRKQAGSTPDFEGEIGTLWYGVEVKRPETDARPDRIVSDGARQLSSSRYHGGILCIDITDLLPHEGIEITTGAAPNPKLGVAEFMSISQRIEDEVFDERLRRFERGREHILSTITFARIFAWDADDPRRLISVRRVRPAFYWKRQRNTLRFHRARQVFSILEIGMLRAGHLTSKNDIIPMPTSM